MENIEQWKNKKMLVYEVDFVAFNKTEIYCDFTVFALQ